MLDQARLTDLLDEWDELREQGQELTAEELCKDCPELLGEMQQRLNLFQAMDWLRDVDDEQAHDSSAFSTVPSVADERTQLPESSLTVDELAAVISSVGLVDAADVAAARRRISGNGKAEDSQTLAQQLVDQRRLTRFQACVLLERRDDPLVIDRYVILDTLGSGGMGVVFKAVHRSLDRIVALKLLPREMVGSPEKAARFRREAKAVAKLSHPNIVAAYDADESAGVHFLAIEYVDGDDLGELVHKQNPLPVPQAVDVIRQAASGLAHAHAQGIIHRDIKPSNLLVSTDGTVKVADLGLASITLPSESVDAQTVQGLTTTGTVIGTVSFISPEQSYDTKQADERSDIYSLGATLCFLLTGKPPFFGENAVQTLIAHREQEIPRLCDVRDEVPPQLDELFQKMLAKRPEDRPQSMQEVIHALDDIPLTEGSGSADTQILDAVSSPQIAGEVETTTNYLHVTDVVGSTESKSPKRRSRLKIAAICLIVGLAAAAIIIRIRDKNGDVIAEVAVPKDGSAEFVSDDGNSTTNKAPISPKHVVPNKPADTRPKIGDIDQRKIAKWVLELGGKLFIKTEQGNAEPQVVEDLPAIPFAITSIVLRTSKVTDSNVDRIAELPALEQLTLKSRSITDEGMVAIGRLTNLRSLTLDGVSVTTDGLQQLNKLTRLHYLHIHSFRQIDVLPHGPFPNLNFLNLRFTKLSSADSLKPLRNLPNLQVLYLANTGIDDAGLSHLADLKSLKDLGLENTHVTDKGLEQLNHLPNLQRLRLEGLAVTVSAIEKLKKLRPNCRIDCDVAKTPAKPRTTADIVHRDLAKWVIQIGGVLSVNSERGYTEVRRLEQLPDAPFEITLIAVRSPIVRDADLERIGRLPELVRLDLSSSYITDAGLVKLSKLTKLTSLVINRSHATDTGLENLKKLSQLVRLNLQGANITQSAIDRLQAALPKCKISWSLTPKSALRPPPADTPFGEQQARAHQISWARDLGVDVEFKNTIGMQLQLIPPGRFLMGYSDECVQRLLGEYEKQGLDLEPYKRRFRDGQPQHPVIITKPYYMGTYPVTVEQYGKFVAATGYKTTAETDGKGGKHDGKMNVDLNWKSPGFRQAHNHPVVQMSRLDAQAFCTWLSSKEGLHYTLPTEAQWEFACRAGTQTQWFFGNDRTLLPEFAGRSRSQQPFTRPVGRKAPNAFGIHNVYGNPQEFVRDWSSPYTGAFQIDPDASTADLQALNRDLRMTVDGRRMVVRGSREGSAWRSLGAMSAIHGESRLTFRVVISGQLKPK